MARRLNYRSPSLLRQKSLYPRALGGVWANAFRIMWPGAAAGPSWFETALTRLLTTRDYWRRRIRRHPYPTETYWRQLWASLKPSTSRALRLDSGASNSPRSRLIGTPGK